MESQRSNLALLSMSMNNGKMTAYEFYLRVRNGPDQFIGTLPERRKDPERITHASIMNWARINLPEDVLQDLIYFIPVRS